MVKIYIVRLTDEERQALDGVIKKLKGSAQKVRRAQILLKANADGPAWTDARIAQTFDCQTRTIEKLRKRFVEEGFDVALHGKARCMPPREKILDGEQEAKVIALPLGPAPEGCGNWSLRLLANKIVELEIVDSISHETVRQTLKKTA